MSHRLRLAMQKVGLAPMGGEGETVEIDETIIGRQEKGPKPRGGAHGRNVVLTLVQRGGSARSFHVEGSTVGTLIPIIRANIAAQTAVMTDQAGWYKKMNKDGYFASHESVDHSKEEWARGPVTTNTVEGYFSVFKRGMKGIYQHCGERHLHRYLAEFDFRYSHRMALGVNDTERADLALAGIVGKRLTYRTTVH